MIKLKNMSEYVISLRKSGLLSASSDVDAIVVPAAGYIKAIVVGLGLMGTDGTGSPTADVRVDIKKNGTSLFTGSSPYFVWSHALQIGTANTPIAPDGIPTLTTNPAVVAKYDRLQLDVTQILNGSGPTQPKDLFVQLVLVRGQNSVPEATMLQQLSELDR